MSTGAYRNPHRAIAAVAALLLSGCLAACGSLPFNSAGCPGWVGYDTPSDAAESSEAVLFGVVQEQSGTVPIFSTTANVWTVRVDEWLKGAGPAEIDVVSPPANCGPDDSAQFPDPFDEVGQLPVVVFLTDSQNGWQALSPGQGIVPSPDGQIPEEWPDAP